ncbi:HD-GYP domain-containing protein [Cohnella phaseoli]|uniref:HD-GYP domain-containing protein (C-di-GMP phosphodiesterase class II) n=1 Tax=Cohnella phaseoli TaxID=456490 RepID=A0A3D9I1F8_9BACL|nr:HD domain-containing phosphohydrolase [Cohnella phaseoli]RED55574.1 HD-GYP domain-containing protein (c-di-GMP phosphodiesterase class II) [Cohnella phaseoli]
MIIIHTSQCRPGMKLGRSIYTEQGHVLAGRGFVLTEHAIRRLQQLGMPYLHIEEEGTEDIAPDQAIRDETTIVLHGALTHVMDELLGGDKETLSPNVVRFVCDATKILVDDLKSRRNAPSLPVHLTTTLTDGDKQHFLEHAMNVGVCATRLGLEEGLATEDLHALAIGAMLHDVGRLLLPSGLKARVTLNDQAYMKHAELGYKLLRDSGFPLMAAHCALFHHERLDGSGYPFGLEGKKIHPHHQWISIFDMFDTMVNGRGNGAPMLPHEALEVLYGGAGSLYDMDKVRRLRDNMALFPRGTTVRLSTGELGVVSALHEDSKQRPIVRVIRSSEGELLSKPYEVDLKRQLHLMISGFGNEQPEAKETPERLEPRSNKVFHVV